jgi:hypothetical protein
MRIDEDWKRVTGKDGTGWNINAMRRPFHFKAIGKINARDPGALIGIRNVFNYQIAPELVMKLNLPGCRAHGKTQAPEVQRKHRFPELGLLNLNYSTIFKEFKLC